MIADPYSVLGISPNAADEEVTQAYRKLAKKFHPDLNPGDKAAEQKMREINAAYEQIKTGKTGGASYERPDGSYGPQQQSGGSPYGNQYGDPFEDIFSQFFGGGWSNQQSSSPNLQMVRNYLSMRQYQQALYVLSQIPDRNAEWYYYSAIANAGIGNRVTALNNAQEAVRIEPDNHEYLQLLQQLQQSGSAYRQSGQGFGFDMRSVGRTIFQLMMAQLFCMFCCRPC